MEDDAFFDDALEEAVAEEPAGAKKRGGRRRSLCWPVVPPEEQQGLYPVRIVQERECWFKKKPEKKRGCLRCGRAKKDLAHLGTSISLNVFGSGANRFAYQNAKKQWEDVIKIKLEAEGLPKGLGRIVAEAVMCFPDRAERDQGNFRFIIEKALGDALVDGGWLWDDDWSRYEFGNLAYAYEKGRAATEIMLFPEWPRIEAAEKAEEPVPHLF